MNDETNPPFPTSKSKESKLFGCSIRGLIVLLVVTTVCIMSWMARKVEEPLYTLVGLTVGYYFGQNQRNQTKP